MTMTIMMMMMVMMMTVMLFWIGLLAVLQLCDRFSNPF